MASDFTVDRASKKYVLGSNGFLKEYANDEPAIEFNADGSYKGVLVEPQSENEALHSEDFTNVYWSTINATINADQTTSPNNTTTADKITGSGTSTFVVVRRQSVTLTANDYTLSFYAKADTYDIVSAGVVGYTSATGSTRVYADLTNGTVSGGTIREIGNGWYRISTTFKPDSGDLVGDIQFTLAKDLSNVQFDSNADTNGKSAFVWGAQLEESPIATSYIPTTTGAVTRVADDIYLTGASSLIGQTEGTLFVEVDWQLTSGTLQILLGATDATFSNGFRIYNDSSPVNLIMRARADGVDLTVQGEASTAYSGIQKIAFAYAENDFELYRNGSSISSDTSGSLSALATVTDIDFGQSSGATAQANMWIRAVALFTTRLSDAECEALTTI